MLAVQNENGALFRYRFGDVEFDESRFELRIGGETIEVQPKPLELLASLLRTPGEVVTSEEILQSVWKYHNPGGLETNVIGTALTKLRSALGKDAHRIVNLPRVGYRIEGRVERMVVGRALSSGLALESGMPVPLRPNFVLRDLLSRSKYSEVWRARHAKTDEPRIYKFSPAGDRLPALKREATLYRVLRESLGDRPDVVRVIDWNFTEAPFFLECEDAGQNLRKWAEDAGQLRALDLPQRIALFLQVADAVAAAHSVGVLHKDLKPDNVLIAPTDAGWQVKLTDFGSGHLLEPARLEDLGITQLGFTATQGVIGDATTGTLLYLAPELTRGETPTIQSDVYALGLMLYQLVTGDMRRPLVPGWQRDVADELLQQDIAAATDGNPNHRLGSVNELANRLRRTTERREELARQRALEQAARQAQEALKRSKARRPWLIGSVASLVLGLVASTVLYFDSRHAYLAADEQRSRAEAVNKFLNDDLIGAADPTGPGAERDPSVRVLLARAAARLDGRFAHDPLTKASLDLTIGKAYSGLSDYSDAETYQKRGVAQMEAVEGSYNPEVLEAQYWLIRTLEQEGHFDEASQLMEHVDRAAGPLLEHPSKLSMIAAWCHGDYFLSSMRPALALPYFERAESIRAKAVPDDATWLFRVHSNLSWCYVRLGRNIDSLNTLSPLMQTQYSLARMGAMDWAKVRLEYALALSNLSRFEEAETTLKDALDPVRQVLGDDNYTTALMWNHLGTVYQSEGKWEEAVAAQTKASAIVRRVLGDQAPSTMAAESELAIAIYLAGRINEALPLLQSTHANLTSKLGASAPMTQDAAFYLASALAGLGRTDEALSLLPSLLPADLNSMDPCVDWEQRLAGLKGTILVRQGNMAEGQPLLRSAIAQLRRDNAPAWVIAPLKASLGASTTLVSRK